MSKQMKYKGAEIPIRLIVWFLVIALAPLAFYGLEGFDQNIKTAKNNMMNTLVYIADNKVQQIRTYFNQREKNVALLAKLPDMKNALNQFEMVFKQGSTVSQKGSLISQKNNSIESEYRQFLAYCKESGGYDDLLLISPEGDVVFSVEEEEDYGKNLSTSIYKDTQLAVVFSSVKVRLETDVSNYKHYLPSGRPAAFIAAPVLKEGELIGVVALQVGSSDINEIVNDYSGLGKTGEIVIASKEGDKAVFVMPLRYDPDAAFIKNLVIGNKIGLPLQDAVNGKKGEGMSVDYRGKEVLAAWRFIPDLRWGVAVKIDTEEAFASVVRFRNILLIIGVITLIAALILAFFISKSISGPIRKMVEMFSKQETANVDLQKEINERLLAEKQVRMLSFAVEQSPVSIAITDSNGNIEYVNRKFAQVRGGPHGGVVEQDAESQKADVNIFGEYKELWQTISSGKEWQGEFSNKSKEGVTSWEFASISPVRDFDSNITHYLTIKEDITDRKRAEHEIQKNMNFMTLLQNVTLVANETSSVQEAMQVCIDKVCVHTGFSVGHVYLPDSEGTLVSSNIWYFDHPTKYEVFRKVTNDITFVAGIGLPGRVLESGETEWISDVTQNPDFIRTKMEKSIVVKSGFAFPVLEQKKVVAVLEFYSKEVLERDDSLMTTIEILATQLGRVTERKRSEGQLRKAKDSAETANKVKGEFLANMSHEIRTPLNGVIGMINILKETELNHVQREYANTVHESAGTLLKIINDILDFSKMEAGKLELENIDFSLRETVEGTIDTFAIVEDKKYLELSCFVDPVVPSILRGDPVRLRQVLINLVNNAIRFTDVGEVVISAGLTKETKSQITVRFEVRDTGVGIPVDRMDRLFKSFSQVDASTTRKYGGTGLGLSIAKQISGLMGGQIGVDSEEGNGSTFWFTAVFKKSRSIKQKLPFGPGSMENLHVLVVDDNDTCCHITRVYLESLGCLVDETSSVEEARKKLHNAVNRENPFNIALFDFCIPDVERESFCEEIKSEPQLQELILVALVPIFRRKDKDAEYFRRLGFATSICKPVRQAQLFEGIRMVTGEAANDEKGVASQIAQDPIQKKSERCVRILLAEDNQVNQKIAIHYIEKKFGYSADVVNNGREAIESLEKADYDLVVMDCQMPEMDGYEATRIIRDEKSSVRDHRIPIIAMTANAMKGDRERCLDVGMDDYIDKPINAKKFEILINRHICNGGE